MESGMTNTTQQAVTAAMLAIGDELLSGRTKDKNIGHLADMLTAAGIDLKEVRIVPDEEDAIVIAINALRPCFDYVFTSGGIGPTHDDITADAVSRAFEVPCIYDDKAMKLLADNYARRGLEFTQSRQRMARMPQGAEHIDNSVSAAPGFQIGNVYVMAGVPSVFQAMLDNVVPGLRAGRKLLSKAMRCPFGEGVIGVPLAAIQKDHPDTIIGSYPKFEEGRFSTELVVRGSDLAKVEAAAWAIESMIEMLQEQGAA